MDLEKLKQGILVAQRYHQQVVLVLGQSASELFYDASATEGLLTINIGLDLSAKLLEVPNTNHPKVAALFFAELIEQAHVQTLLLDHIEILFDRSLAWFPFVITAGSFQLNQSKFLEVIHQGVGNDLLALKK
ncbi:BREX-3 system P-loop-containing protein BrxF [Methylobacter sp.]|uniref:BREX-3 system P-loop-containing protein BrxF n=1 Tax=Methylobacter sp. TaxID=2051955 RepID=UPI002488F6F5|nr:BREX-3 system P-loop-containing protein BrxF [Methylobacter sp.]MDI1276147.1 BREX-3 system P-loop-containing protein BrxF [Methylobacter sp.]MDI1356964.1 BREX-3 system P-loop-containing protein BrxF [Methylobacter sp.]